MRKSEKEVIEDIISEVDDIIEYIDSTRSVDRAGLSRRLVIVVGDLDDLKDRKF